MSTIKMRRVREPGADPARWKPGIYIAHYRPPGAPGYLPFAEVRRFDVGGVTIAWHWDVHDPHQLLPIELDGVPLRGAVAHKREAEAAIAAVAEGVTEFWEAIDAYLWDGGGSEWELDELVADHASTAATVTIDTVLDALSVAVETAEVWLMDHADESVEDRLRLYGALHEAVSREGRLSRVTAELRTELTVEMTEGARVAETADGRIWKAKRTPTRKGFDKVALRSAVNRHALAPVPDIDEATGEILSTREPSAAEAVDVVWQAADVATGRTKVLRETFGVDLDEYAEVSWKDELTEVAEADLKPEELATLRGEEIP
jgi:hypothetical protein